MVLEPVPPAPPPGVIPRDHSICLFCNISSYNLRVEKDRIGHLYEYFTNADARQNHLGELGQNTDALGPGHL